jgi:hypothetical protein
MTVRVPAGCRVEIDGPLVRVRAFGLFGGVRVER